MRVCCTSGAGAVRQCRKVERDAENLNMWFETLRCTRMIYSGCRQQTDWNLGKRVKADSRWFKGTRDTGLHYLFEM